MFFEAWLLLGILGGASLALLIWSYFSKRRKTDGYRWQPEQDYDVVQRGETSMNPPFPHMIKRENGDTGNDTTKSLDSNQRTDTGKIDP